MRMEFYFGGLGADRSEALNTDRVEGAVDASETYTIDKGHAPGSLNDLVTSGYLKSIPKDPK